MLFCVLFFFAHETPLSNKTKIIILPIIIKIIIIITIVITLIIIILAFKSFED